MAGAVDPSPENQVRGQSFRSILSACDEVLGAGGRERVLRALPKELEEAYLYGAIVAGGWYPIEWYIEVLRAIRADAPSRDDAVRRVARVSAREDAKGVYKFILRLTTPSFVLSHLGRVIGTFIRHSDFEITDRKPGLVRMDITIPGASLEMWEDFAGAAETILTIAGAEQWEVSVRPKSQLSSATMLAKWSGAEG